jgi:hypothetical protein
MNETNPHKERPGFGVMFWEDMKDRKTPQAPDFKGFLVLEMDYKAGEKLKIAAWKKPTSRGTDLLSLKEDNWTKRQNEQRNAPREVTRGYQNKSSSTGRVVDDDNEVPF